MNPISVPADLPLAVRDLGMRLGAGSSDVADVQLTQTGKMRLKLESERWMPFRARQLISPSECAFTWNARFGRLRLISVCDELTRGGGRLDVTALGSIPLARTPRTAALTRGELMRYLAEIAWAPDAIFANPALRWRVDGPQRISLSAGDGDTAVEIFLTLDSDGRVAETFAPDRPRSATDPILLTPWLGRFSDYHSHSGRWIPFSGEVSWGIEGRIIPYWRGEIEAWVLASEADDRTR